MDIQYIIELLWIFFQIAVGCNLILPFLLLVIYAIFSSKKKQQPSITEEADYAIIVTAYEQTTLIPSVIKSLLQLKYSNFLIYIVADKCDVSELKFEDQRVIVLRPEEVLPSNTCSHFYAIQRFKRPHERLTIIDSDNLVDPNYLNTLNEYFDYGARNIYYHFYDGKVLFNVGSSARLAGSGMAFTTKLYNDCLAHQDIIGAGFDKILQKEIVDRGYRIAFAERARWINTWFKYFSFGFGLVDKEIFQFNWNKLLFGLILLRPPLFIFLLIGLFCMLLNLIINPFIAFIWLLGFVIFVLGFLMELAINKTDARIYQSLWGIPKFVFYQVLSLLKLPNANKHSVATKHFHADKKAN
jgi:hypothetical protein